MRLGYLDSKHVHIIFEFLLNKNLSKTQFRTEWTNDINS